MKKFLCLMLSLIMVLALIAGCSKNTPDDTTSEILSVDGNSESDNSDDTSVADESGEDVSDTNNVSGNTRSANTGKTSSGKNGNTSSGSSVAKPHVPTIKKLRVQVDGRTVGANNTISKWLKKNLGFSIELVHIGTADIGEQLGLMAAADNLPDVFTIATGQPIYYSLRDSGQLLDIESILNDYGPNVVAARGKKQIDSMRDSDGKLRCVANCTESCYDVMMIRKDWLNKLNLKVPTTTEELRKVMNAFVYKDPDGNGIDDTYGFLSLRGGARGMMTLFAAFGATPGDIWQVQNGKVVYSFLQTDRMIPAMKYIRSLYEQGLLGKGVDFQMSGSAYNTVVSEGKVGIVQDNCWYLSTDTSWFYADPTAEWIYMDPIKGPNGYSGYVNYQNPYFTGRTCIAANSKDPIAAMQYLNFIADYDNMLTVRTGIEGIHWNYDAKSENGISYTEKYSVDTALIEDGVTATYVLPFLCEDPPRQYLQSVCIDAYNRRRELETKWNGVLYEYPEELIKREDISLEYTWYAWWKVQVMIKESKDIDADYAQLVTDLKDTYQLNEITKIYQKAYDSGRR